MWPHAYCSGVIFSPLRFDLASQIKSASFALRTSAKSIASVNWLKSDCFSLRPLCSSGEHVIPLVICYDSGAALCLSYVVRYT